VEKPVISTVFEELHFLRPWLLLAFIPFVFFAWRLLKQRSKAGLWESVCEPELMPFIIDASSASKGKLHYLFFIVSTLVILAMAGPTFEKLPTPVFRQQSALVMVLDLSRSMNAQDIKPSRLERAKFKISDLLRMRKDGQTALVVFADQAFVVTPLTNDAKTIENQLPALTTDIMPSQGSNLLIGIKKAADLLEQAGVRGGDILVLTDAVTTDPRALASLVEERGLRISVIGVGTKQGAPVPNDRGGFISDDAGNVILMTLDLVGLRELANLGNGLFQTISSDDRDAERYVRFIDNADNAETEASTDLFADRWREFGPWLLLCCIPLLPLAFRRGLLTIFIAINASVISSPATADSWFYTQDQRAQSAFKNEQYSEAKNQFLDKRWRAAAAYREGDFETAAGALEDPQSAEDWYNKGNALARSGSFEDAIAAYEKSLTRSQEDLPKDSPEQATLSDDAEHNKSLIEELLKQQNQQQNQGEGDDKEGENDQNQSGESPGEGEPSESNREGGESSSESDEMNPEEQERPEEQATQSAEEKEQAEKKAQEEAKEASESGQDGGKPNDQKADAAPMTEAQAEQEQATEQWLRQIPDDPGGLLRRKFEYEYQKRGAQSDRNANANAKSRGQQW
jgi:Ca-activated chloride channel homolog